MIFVAALQHKNKKETLYYIQARPFSEYALIKNTSLAIADFTITDASAAHPKGPYRPKLPLPLQPPV